MITPETTPVITAGVGVKTVARTAGAAGAAVHVGADRTRQSNWGNLAPKNFSRLPRKGTSPLELGRPFPWRAVRSTLLYGLAYRTESQPGQPGNARGVRDLRFLRIPRAGDGGGPAGPMGACLNIPVDGRGQCRAGRRAGGYGPSDLHHASRTGRLLPLRLTGCRGRHALAPGATGTPLPWCTWTGRRVRRHEAGRGREYGGRIRAPGLERHGIVRPHGRGRHVRTRPP